MTVPKQQAIRVFRRYFVLTLAVFLLLLVYVKLSARQDNINACKRGAATAAQDARAWTAARNARLAAYEKTHQPEDLDAANTYRETVRVKQERARLDCSAAYGIL